MRKAFLQAPWLALLGLAALHAQNGDFGDALLKNRYELRVQDGHLAGSGASVLRDAISQSQFVLIGEDHGIAEIPAFVGGVFEIAGQQGFRTLALETGPLAAGELERWIGQRESTAAVVEFEKKYPISLPVYTYREEFGLLQRCAQSVPGGKLRLWGLDQEFSGSPKLILTRILETSPGEKATAMTRRLLREDEDAMLRAAKSGNRNDIFMYTASGQELEELRGLLLKEGSARAVALIGSLLESRRIYTSWLSGVPYESYHRRSMLMKSSFMGNFQAAAREDGKPPKVLLKFGGFHVGRGFNPLHINDLGNFVAELAESEGGKSLHIMILGVKGAQLVVAGVGRPYQASRFDYTQGTQFAYLKPMFDRLASGGWTMFDLRGLRNDFNSFGKTDKRTEWQVFGYDFLVLIPDVTPSTELR